MSDQHAGSNCNRAVCGVCRNCHMASQRRETALSGERVGIVYFVDRHPSYYRAAASLADSESNRLANGYFLADL